MRVSSLVFAGLLTVGAAGCRRTPPAEPSGTGSPGVPPDQEPPVALNADSPIQYPPRLYDQKVEGDVMLRLFVDSAGRLLPESSRVAESSNYPALDSAALSGARRLRFAPARRHGLSIATAFLQPVEFRHPQAGSAASRGGPGGPGGPDTTRPRPTPAPPPAATTARPVRRDTTQAKRDTVPRLLDSIRTVPDSAAKRDTNAVPH
jgi:TonB family protein